MLDHVKNDTLTRTADDFDRTNLTDLERRLISLFRRMCDRDKQQLRRVTEVMVMSYDSDECQ